MRQRLLSALANDRRGSSVVEFGFVAPALCLVLVGAFDTGHSLYMRAVLQGIVQKVARDSTLETNTTTDQQDLLDAKVRASVRAIANNATINITRRYYRTFSLAASAQAEAWTDTDGNGTCNNNEPFQDANLNGSWDADGGDSGQGGAKDKTLYTVSVSYPRFFPLWRFIGGSNTTRISAATVLANQPYNDQGSYGTPTVGHCP
ncbi:TadE/TadG family type IV pilus assembly protein [Sphingomonas sp. 28-63-12]|uniref:TadE/TadG family type IV pilus assembly protein n=1 Tax=Sphingomonas sp. 28-63-12 TaxID=1970434 RepID=UPI000BDB1810|nr:MAG: hypothetical protein B7Y47_03610 [Sphingomonas sp. 28-63-12]